MGTATQFYNERASQKYHTLNIGVYRKGQFVKLNFACCDKVERIAAATSTRIGEAIINHECAPQTINPALAKTMADLVTPKQLVAIRAIANNRAVNAEAECALRYKCLPEELNRRFASFFIDHLKTL